MDTKVLRDLTLDRIYFEPKIFSSKGNRKTFKFFILSHVTVQRENGTRVGRYGEGASVTVLSQGTCTDNRDGNKKLPEKEILVFCEKRQETGGFLSECIPKGRDTF